MSVQWICSDDETLGRIAGIDSDSLSIARKRHRDEETISYNAMLARAETDRALLNEHFQIPISDAPVRAASLGDFFGLDGTALIEFSGGGRVVYKARSMATDAYWDELLSRVGIRGVHALPRGDYGWAEWISPSPVQDAHSAARYFHNAGAMLALLRVLGGGDAHARNLIAVGDMPTLIDCEAIIYPQSGEATLYRSAMLPVCARGVNFPPRLAGLTGDFRNLPYLPDGTRFNGSDFTREITDGYAATEALLPTIFTEPPAMEYRVILRGQKIYGDMLAQTLRGEITSPGALFSDEILREESERLSAGYYPRFYSILGKRGLFAHGQPLEGELPCAADGVSIMENLFVAAYVAATKKDIDRQAAIIRTIKEE